MKIVLILIKLVYILLIDKSQKKFVIKRYIPNFNPQSEEEFYPYNFTSSDTIDGGIYVFDTASFYTWKNIPNKNIYNDEENIITITTKYNEEIKGTIGLTSNNLNLISLNSRNYSKNFGSICIPKKVPDDKIKQIEDILEIKDGRFYNYLDLIKNEVSQKYINYIQESIQSGYILFGEKDEIFDIKKNEKDIKTCECVNPIDNDDFLNYWNCKITSFSSDNIILSSLYSKSINGDIYAIFALSEEYIIAPKKTGEEIINYYRELIGKKKCSMENYKSNMKRMICEKINYSQLPDFTIILEGEISLIALSFDLFKNVNESYIYFKILLNELDTKEYWYLGDPIIKNYNFLFDYNTPGKEKITIVSSDKYESLSIIVTFISSSFIGLIFFGFLVFARIRINILSKAKKKNQNDISRKAKKKINKIIRKQNDFEIPEGNIPIQNLIRNSNLLNEDNSDDSKIEDEDEEEEQEQEKESINSSDISSDSDQNLNIRKSSISKSFGNENDLENKIKELKKKRNNINKNNNEIEMNDLSYLNSMNYTEEGECEMIGEDEGSIPPLNT